MADRLPIKTETGNRKTDASVGNGWPARLHSAADGGRPIQQTRYG